MDETLKFRSELIVSACIVGGLVRSKAENSISGAVLDELKGEKISASHTGKLFSKKL